MLKPNDRDVLDALCRTNLSAFTQWAFGIVDPCTEYLHNWHIDVVAENLELVHRREITDLIINIPPGYLKSISVNVAFTAWTMGHNPSEWIISTSHGKDLSLDMSRRVKLIMEHPLYRRIFPETVLDKKTDYLLTTTKQGKRYAGSFGGGITGKDARLIIVDDPHDRKDARNPDTLKKACLEFDQGLSTRIRDKKTGARVIIMQRLHTDDLTGYLLRRDGILAKGGKWHHVKIQMEATRREFWYIKSPFPGGAEVVIKREAGDLLHPAREGAKEIAAKEIELGTYGYAGQYQQEPIPTDGGIIKGDDLRRYDIQPERSFFIQIVLSLDTAQKEKELNDPSVISVFGVTPKDHFYLLDVWRKKVQFPELVETTEDMVKVWRPDVILIEDKVSGTSLIQVLRKKAVLIHDVTQDRIPMNIIPMLPERDKINRMDAESPAIRAGRLWVPGGERRPSWMTTWEAEVLSFPLVSHDDQVDSLSQFLCYCRTRPGTTVTVGDRQPSVADNMGHHGLDLGGFGLW